MPQRRTQRRALIIGGSMSGLLAGMMLARRGWGVDIFERVAGAASRRISAGDAERRRAHPLGPPRHSRSGARRNRGARFFVWVNSQSKPAPAAQPAFAKIRL